MRLLRSARNDAAVTYPNMSLTKQKLGDSGRTGFLSFSEAEIQLLNAVIPVGASFIQLIGFDPLVDRSFIIHSGKLSATDPSDGMLHHLILQIAVEEVHLIVMEQDTAMIEAILLADPNSELITALIDIEVFAVAKLAPAKQLIEK